MWIKTLLQSTLLVNNDDFPDVLHVITDCHIRKNPTAGDRDQILFEHNGSYYIAEGKNNDDSGAFQPLTPLGFVDDYTLKTTGTRRYYAFREYNSDEEVYEWFLTAKNGKTPWLVLETAQGQDVVLQEGYWKLNTATKKWEPQKLDNSKNPPSSYDIDDFDGVGVQLWKNDSLTGVYKWEGVGAQNDIIAGWKKYTHSGGQVAIEESNLIETSTNQWDLNYNNQVFRYTGSLPLSDFTMNSTTTTDILQMSYDSLIAQSREVWYFDGAVHNVV